MRRAWGTPGAASRDRGPVADPHPTDTARGREFPRRPFPSGSERVLQVLDAVLEDPQAVGDRRGAVPVEPGALPRELVAPSILQVA